MILIHSGRLFHSHNFQELAWNNRQPIGILLDTTDGMSKLKKYRLDLIEGTSEKTGFVFGSQRRRALFRVGTAIECNWRITSLGVKDHHFMMIWNGKKLSVIDVGAGDLWLDGKPVVGSIVTENGTIQFGHAVIRIRSEILTVSGEVARQSVECTTIDLGVIESASDP